MSKDEQLDRNEHFYLGRFGHSKLGRDTSKSMLIADVNLPLVKMALQRASIFIPTGDESRISLSILPGHEVTDQHRTVAHLPRWCYHPQITVPLFWSIRLRNHQSDGQEELLESIRVTQQLAEAAIRERAHIELEQYLSQFGQILAFLAPHRQLFLEFDENIKGLGLTSNRMFGLFKAIVSVYEDLIKLGVDARDEKMLEQIWDSLSEMIWQSAKQRTAMAFRIMIHGVSSFWKILQNSDQLDSRWKDNIVSCLSNL